MIDVDFYARVDLELRKIPFCSSRCAYFIICPVAARDETENSVCALLGMPEKERRRFVNLYLRGRDGLKAEAIESLYVLARKLRLSDDADDILKYLDALLKVDRSFKVDVRKVEETPKIEQEKVPDIVQIQVVRKEKPPDPLEKTVRQVEGELDNNPESLFNSPVIDEIAARQKISNFKLPGDKKVISIHVDPHTPEMLV